MSDEQHDDPWRAAGPDQNSVWVDEDCAVARTWHAHESHPQGGEYRYTIKGIVRGWIALPAAYTPGSEATPDDVWKAALDWEADAKPFSDYSKKWGVEIGREQVRQALAGLIGSRAINNVLYDGGN